MRKRFLSFFLSINFLPVLGQSTDNSLCDCIQQPLQCIAEISVRRIVRSDTIIAHHSYCYRIISYDENDRFVKKTYLCIDKPTDSFLFNFYDPSTLGDKTEDWYDTTGRSVYHTYFKNDSIKECYWYHYPLNARNYDYTVGYKNGEVFKEIFTWDEYGSGYKQRKIITAKTITTIVYTDKVGRCGYRIQKKSTTNNKTGKVE